MVERFPIRKEYHSILRNAPVNLDSCPGDLVRCPGQQGSILRDVRSWTQASNQILIDRLPRVDVADSSLDILVHDAIYSTARSPVSAPRHENASQHLGSCT